MGSRVLSARAIVAGEYLALAVVSAFVLWLVLR
jgi:fumarate reductase subunit C